LPSDYENSLELFHELADKSVKDYRGFGDEFFQVVSVRMPKSDLYFFEVSLFLPPLEIKKSILRKSEKEKYRIEKVSGKKTEECRTCLGWLKGFDTSLNGVYGCMRGKNKCLFGIVPVELDESSKELMKGAVSSYNCYLRKGQGRLVSPRGLIIDAIHEEYSSIKFRRGDGKNNRLRII